MLVATLAPPPPPYEDGSPFLGHAQARRCLPSVASATAGSGGGQQSGRPCDRASGHIEPSCVIWGTRLFSRPRVSNAKGSRLRLVQAHATLSRGHIVAGLRLVLQIGVAFDCRKNEPVSLTKASFFLHAGQDGQVHALCTQRELPNMPPFRSTASRTNIQFPSSVRQEVGPPFQDMLLLGFRKGRHLWEPLH